MTSPWTTADIPDLSGRRALVTGVTSGLGEATARALARAGAQVVLAARNPDKLKDTVAALTAAVPSADLVPLRLDLADLGSVRRAAAEAAARGPLDLLVNNAGVMATPHGRTLDGFELQFGTNHLGHFALTGLLFDALAEARGRVVTVSSLASHTVRGVSLRDPRDTSRPYRRWRAYAESKLANLLFTVELGRRGAEAGVVAVAAHPGYTRTGLVAGGLSKGLTRPVGLISEAVTAFVGQGADAGALPQLRAATEPGLASGTFLGPAGIGQVRGGSAVVPLPGPAQDEEAAAALWSLSERATGVSFP